MDPHRSLTYYSWHRIAGQLARSAGCCLEQELLRSSAMPAAAMDPCCFHSGCPTCEGTLILCEGWGGPVHLDHVELVECAQHLPPGREALVSSRHADLAVGFLHTDRPGRPALRST